VELAHREGVLTAASLMVAGAAADDAVAIARRTPDLRVGLHLALVDAPPICDPAQIRHIVDRKGRLRCDLAVLGAQLAFSAQAREELRAEIEAQFAAFAATGLPLDHVNAHKHYHLHPQVGAMILEIGPRYGMRSLRVPVEPPRLVAGSGAPGLERTLAYAYARRLARRAQQAGVATADYVFGIAWSGAFHAGRLRGLLERLPGGFVEIYLHPATRDDFDGAAPGYHHRDELAALLDPACAKALGNCWHARGGYADALAHADYGYVDRATAAFTAG
jgi:chitin disaccharide deacetylase